MTKVEELRERLIQAIGTYGVAEDKGMPSELCETLDSLIAAARAEGLADGAEKIARTVARAAEMLWTAIADISSEDCWSKQSIELQKIAARWSNFYYSCLPSHPKESDHA